MSCSPLCTACLKNTQFLWADNFDSKEYCFYKCLYCGLHFIYPIPDAQVIDLLYNKNYPSYQFDTIDIDIERAYPPLKVKIARWRFAKCRKTSFRFLLEKFLAIAIEIASGRMFSFPLGVPLSLPLGAEILDVGCGSGKWLLFMQRQGYVNLMGQDVSGPAASRLKPFGIPVVVGTLPEVGLPAELFDLIRMEHVLEHVSNPIEYLNEARRLLKSHGRIVMTVPAIESLSYKISGRDWLALEFPLHIYHYSLQSLRHIASRSGLTIRRYRYLSVWEQVIGSVDRSYLGSNLYRVLRKRIALISCRPFYAIINAIFTTGDFLSVEFVKNDM